MFDSLRLEVEDYKRFYFNYLRQYSEAVRHGQNDEAADLLEKVNEFGDKCGRVFVGSR